jgi:hypothetical protein
VKRLPLPGSGRWLALPESTRVDHAIHLCRKIDRAKTDSVAAREWAAVLALLLAADPSLLPILRAWRAGTWKP